MPPFHLGACEGARVGREKGPHVTDVKRNECRADERDGVRLAASALSPGRLGEAAARLERAVGYAGDAVAEQFMSDVHGEAGAFDHLVRSASGETRRMVDRVFPEWDACERAAVAAALYYPEDARHAGLAREAGVGLAELSARVRRHAMGRLHVVGDLWDRGSRGDEVVDVLMGCAEADIQWGNHDVCWMGAAAGDPVCIATCLRNNIKYGNVAQFEEGYGIDLEPLRVLARHAYVEDGAMDPVMKAVSALLFKCEGRAVARHPEWRMGDRLLWGAMDPRGASVPVYGVRQPLKTGDFPTFDPCDPYALSAEEAAVMEEFVRAFRASARLQRQAQWLYDHGSVWKVSGDALLFHGCVPLEDDGSLARVDCGEGVFAGRALLDWVDALCRRAWERRDEWSLDWMGYLWCGWRSTFAGRVVKTFERTYIEDKATWKEPEDPYYAVTREDSKACEAVLAQFGVGEGGVIVNGHTPVKLPKGETPVRAGGRRIVIDGGLCRAYRKTTGIAGYTLVRDAEGLRLVTHGEFPGYAAARAGSDDMRHTDERIVRQGRP